MSCAAIRERLLTGRRNKQRHTYVLGVLGQADESIGSLRNNMGGIVIVDHAHNVARGSVNFHDSIASGLAFAEARYGRRNERVLLRVHKQKE